MQDDYFDIYLNLIFYSRKIRIIVATGYMNIIYYLVLRNYNLLTR